MTTMVRTISLASVLALSPVVYGGWQQLAAVPDKLGLAAPFAGISGHTLLVAGGANFPDKAPWEGGKKAWYDTIYALDQKNGRWQKAGKLPRPLGYGVSVSYRDRMICVGGSDAERCYADAFELNYEKGDCRTVNNLSPLPVPLANACAACVEGVLYVAGGQNSNEAAQAQQSVYTLDLTDPRAAWKTIPALPAPGRILAAAASFDGSFYIFGGASLSEAPDHTAQRKYLTDAWRYTPGSGWKQLADLPRPAVAAPSPAPTDDTGIYLLGGDDGSHAGFKPPQLHPGFNREILHLDAKLNTWKEAGEMPASRVTVPCVPWDDGWVITSGEMRPGVRSPEVWMFNAKDSR